MGIAAEQSVLGGLMLDNSKWPEVSSLIGAPDFLGVGHGVIFETIGAVISGGIEADIITVYDALPTETQNIRHFIESGFDDSGKEVSTLAYLGWLAKNTPCAANVVMYAEILRDEFRESKPKIDASYNATLDASKKYCQVDLARHIPNGHVLKELAKSTAAACNLPLSSALLVGMAVFSSIACRRFSVAYKHSDEGVPIGLYVVSEQPPGAGKTRCLSTFQRPFFTAHKEALVRRKEKMQELAQRAGGDSDAGEELAALKKEPFPALFITNATPEAMEETLMSTGGYFSAVSSEQSLFDSLLGLSYGDGVRTNNGEVLLCGFDWGYMSSIRITRAGFTGNVGGGVALFAQEGGVEKILTASNGTGLAQRFLLLGEQHQLGTCDHHNKPPISRIARENYELLALPIADAVLGNWKDGNVMLNISKQGWWEIEEAQNNLEPHLADGGKYSHPILRGAAAKINMQIMKIAANLHLLDATRGTYDDIAERHVKSAILIATELFEALAGLCMDKGILGARAEFSAIINYLTKSHRPRTERDIMNSLRTTAPFSELSAGKSEAIRAALYEMDRQGLVHCAINAQPGGKEFKIYSLSQ